MANEKRLIDYQKAREIVLDELKGKVTTVTAVMLSTKMKYATVDAVPLDQYNELKERYKRLLETADILDSALRAYQRKYGDLDDEDAKMDGDGDG